MNYDFYRNRVRLNGKTKSEREIKNTQKKIIDGIGKNPSYKKVIINDKEIDLVIDHTNDLDIFSIKSMPDYELYPGDIIDWEDAKWLVLKVKQDKKIYSKGTMRKCVYELKWQNVLGEIIEQPVIVVTNGGSIDNDKLVMVDNDQRVVYLSYNDETLQIKKGWRFFIDNDKLSPTPYEVINFDNVSNVINGRGYIVLTLKATLLNEKTDNIELGVCDYKSISNVTDDNNLRSEIISSMDNIVLGYKQGTQIKSIFYEEDLEMNDGNPQWEVVSDDNSKLKVTENDKILSIYTNDSSMLGMNIKVVLTDGNGKYPSVDKNFVVESIY